MACVFKQLEFQFLFLSFNKYLLSDCHISDPVLGAEHSHETHFVPDVLEFAIWLLEKDIG